MAFDIGFFYLCIIYLVHSYVCCVYNIKYKFIWSFIQNGYWNGGFIRDTHIIMQCAYRYYFTSIMGLDHANLLVTVSSPHSHYWQINPSLGDDMTWQEQERKGLIPIAAKTPCTQTQIQTAFWHVWSLNSNLQYMTLLLIYEHEILLKNESI